MSQKRPRQVLTAVCTALCLTAIGVGETQAQGAFDGQVEPFTYIIMGDPQYPWWPEEDLPSSCDFERHTGDTPEPVERSDGSFHCPIDIFSNTEANDERVNYDSGLGVCTWTWKTAAQECAADLENQARVDAIKSIQDTTDPNGNNPGIWPDNGDPIQAPEAMIINGDLTEFFHEDQVIAYESFYVEQLQDLPVLIGLGNHDYENNHLGCDGAGNFCYQDAIRYMRRGITENHITNFPANWVEAFDPESLAYRWSRGNYVFLQLHNHPRYNQSDDVEPISSSVDWLGEQIQEATDEGKYIVLNMHEYLVNNAIRDHIEGSNVVAIFVGHDLSRVGHDGFVDSSSNDDPKSSGDVLNAFSQDVPVIYSGHAGTRSGNHRSLLVEFQPDAIRFATVDAEGGPSFVSDRLGLSNYRIYRHQTGGATLAMPQRYGFLAMGAPGMDVHTGTVQLSSRIGSNFQNAAGGVDIYYVTEDVTESEELVYAGRYTQGTFSAAIPQAGDRHGGGLAVGDFNGDGYPDVAVGAPEDDRDDKANAGIVTILYGTDTGEHGNRANGALDIQRITIETAGASSVDVNDRFGKVLVAGNFDGDEFDDLAIGVPLDDTCGATDSGAVAILYGSKDGPFNGSGRDNHINQDDLDDDCDDGDRFGAALAVGDFDGDDFDDLAIGVPLESNDITLDDFGRVAVLYGKSSGLTGGDNDDLRQTTQESGDQFGSALAAGDFNGDGYDELAVGVPFENINCDGFFSLNSGQVNIFEGAPGGLRVLASQTYALNQDKIDFEDCGSIEQMGKAVAAGDFDADGFDDLAVGVPLEDHGGISDVGKVFIYYGRGGRLPISNPVIFRQGNLSCCNDESFDQFGSVLATGDVNQDGYDELAVGVPFEDLTGFGNNAGLVNLFWGRAGRLSSSHVETITQGNSDRLISTGPEAFNEFGAALAISPRINTAPQIADLPDATIVENSTYSVTAVVSDDDPFGGETYDWNIQSAVPNPLSPGSVCETILPSTASPDSYSIQPLDDCTYEISLDVTDFEGVTTRETFTLTATNDIASLLFIGGTSALGDEVELRLDIFDRGILDRHFLAIDWGDGTATELLEVPAPTTAIQTREVPLTHIYANMGSYEVMVYVNDDDTLNSGVADFVTATATATITNEAPNITSLETGPDPVEEGTRFELLVEFTDDGAGAGDYRATIDWGDGSSNSVLSFPDPQRSFQAFHSYPDDGEYTAEVTIEDVGGETGSSSTKILVANVAPEVLSFSPLSDVTDEGEEASFQVTWDDKGRLDSHRLLVGWGDGSGLELIDGIPAGDSSTIITHRYRDDGDYSLVVTVFEVDDTSAFGNLTTSATVRNVDPAITALRSPAIVKEIESFKIEGDFVDPGTLDSHKITVDWGDGRSESFTPPVGERSFERFHSYRNDGDYSITVRINDGPGGADDSRTRQITVQNAAPSITFLTGAIGSEGTPINVQGAFTDSGPDDTHKVDIDWGDGQISTSVPLKPNGKSFVASHTYDDDSTGLADGAYQVQVTVIDEADAASRTTGTIQTIISNVAPEISSLGGSLTADEGVGVIRLIGSFTDAGADDSHSVFIQWGDGQSTLFEAIGRSFNVPHSYDDDGSYPITVTVTDDELASVRGNASATIKNVAPSGLQLSATTVNENDITNLTGSFLDPGSLDSHVVAIDWGDGSSETLTPAIATGVRDFSAQHQYLDDDDYRVSVTVTDDDQASVDGNTTAKVNNVAPSGLQLSATEANENDLTSLTGSFADPGSLDSHKVLIDWGDGSSETLAPAIGVGTRNFVATHQYFDNDDYSVSVTVTDDDLGSGNGGTTAKVNNLAPVAQFDVLRDALTGLTIAFTQDGTEAVEGDIDVLLRGTAVELRGSFSDATAADSFEPITIDWGDGSSEVLAIDVLDGTLGGPVSGTTEIGIHDYATDLAPGSLLLTLTVTDDDGGSDTPTASVRLVDAAGAIADAIADLTALTQTASLLAALPEPAVQDALDDLGTARNQGALYYLAEDDQKSAITAIIDAVDHLQTATGDAEVIDRAIFQLALTARSLTERLIVLAEAAATKNSQFKKIDNAIALQAAGDDMLAAEDAVGALEAYEGAVKEVSGLTKVK